MKKFKKTLSLLLSMLMIFSVITALPLTAGAATVTSDTTGGLSLQDLKTKFPNGAYWNHVTNSSHAYGYMLGYTDDLNDYGSCNNPDGYTWSPCYSHNADATAGQRDCNSFRGAQQCCGFAKKLAYDVYGSTHDSWGQVSVWNCKKGDVIHYYASDTNSFDGHWVMVIGRSGNTLTFGEANRGGNCKIVWGRTMDIGSFSRATCYSAPWELPLSSVSPPSNAWITVSSSVVTVGKSVTFNFGANGATEYHIGINRNGVRVITEAVTSAKSYTFNEEGNYTAYVTASNSAGYVDSKAVSFTVFQPINLGDSFTSAIINRATGAAVMVDDDNVVVNEYDGTEEQLWLFERQDDYAYKITNLKTRKCMDVQGSGTTDGTNIRVWEDNGAHAERWYFRKNGIGYSLIPQHAMHGSLDMTGNSSEGTNVSFWTYSDNNVHQIFALKYILSPDYTRTYNGHHYELYNTSIPWAKAYRFCEQQGGHLVTINSQDEQNVVEEIISYATYNKIWVGGTDYNNEGNWNWITGEKMDYTNWNESEPNNGQDNENYLMLYKDGGKWNDIADIYNRTDRTFSFICEYEDSVDASKFIPKKTFDYDGHRYEVYNDRVDWQTAQRICVQKGGHLITIGNEEENSTVSAQIKGTSSERYWIGLTDIELEGKWSWVTGEPLSYTNWEVDEPNNGQDFEDYGEISTNTGKWNDANGFFCTYKNIGFICEYEPVLLGDVNGDGVINIDDATDIQKYVAELIEFTDGQKFVADTDGDGIISIKDVTQIQRYVAEYIDKLG